MSVFILRPSLTSRNILCSLYDDYKIFLWNVIRPRAGSTDLGSILARSKKCSCPPKRSQMHLGLHVVVLNRYGLLFSWRIKRPGRETDHSPPSRTRFWNGWSCTSTFPYAFMACTRATLFITYLYFYTASILLHTEMKVIRVIHGETIRDKFRSDQL